MRKNRNKKIERDKKNVIIYCRVSSEEQRENTSLSYQEQRVREYCIRYNYNIVDCYQEDFTGKDYYLRRPKMKAIYEYCKIHKGEIDFLLCLRWDRFSRNAEFAFTYIRKFREYGVSVNSVENPVICDDILNPDWTTLIGIYCGNAQSEDNKISKRTKDGIHETLKSGKCSNKAPRGYINRQNKTGSIKWVEIDEKEAQPIREAFYAVSRGVESPSRIRQRICPKIAESSFFAMLRNPFYMGKIKVPAYGNDPDMIVEGKHDAMIDEITFHKVQDVLDGKRKKTPKLTKSINPNLYLRKFLICPICGHALTGSESRGNGGKYAYYHCSHNGKHVRRRAEEVNDGFAKYVSCLTPNETVLRLYEAVLHDVRDEQNIENNKMLEKLQDDLDTINKRIARANDLYLDGEIDKADRDEAVSRNKKEAEFLKQRIEIIKTINQRKVEPKLKYSISLLDNMKRFIQDAPVEAKIKLLGSIFPEKIEFDGKNYRTNSYNKVLDLIFQETSKLRGKKKEKLEFSIENSNSVPRPAFENTKID